MSDDIKADNERQGRYIKSLEHYEDIHKARISKLEAELDKVRLDYQEHVAMVASERRPAYEEQQDRIAELEANNERLRAVYEAAKAVVNTCHIESCKSPVGDELAQLEAALKESE